MDSKNVDLFIGMHHEKFNTGDLLYVKKVLTDLDDSKSGFVHGITFQDPTVILLIAIFFGFERFFLGQIGLGIFKLITFWGLGIWWFIDIFTAKSRTRKYNLDKFNKGVVLAAL
jgi:TM2 domain-containing membrane protein YozV